MTTSTSRPVRVAVIGTGPNSFESDAPSMAYHHGHAYEQQEDCDLLACADLIEENGEQFASEFDIADEHVYTDHLQLLAGIDLDLVSVCAPPLAHADIVIDCIEHNMGAVHCEKPMALTWDGALRMTEAAQETGVQLTINHQRRFGEPWRRAHNLLQNNVIGQLERVEMAAPNLFDWGTHCFDLCGMYAGEPSSKWVLGQIGYSEENIVYGAHQENQAITTWEYETGINGFARTGDATPISGAFLRLEGSEGHIEIRSHENPPLRYWNAETDGWQQVDCDRSSFTQMVNRAIDHVTTSLRSGEEPTLSAMNALKSTELIFGTWESAWSRRRIEMPLDISGNPLEQMVKNGDLDVSSDERSVE